MRILQVDLIHERLDWLEWDADITRQYMGGRGVGVRYLYDHLPPHTDPLGPDNILTLMTSPLMGVGSISVVKLCGVTKSPATNTILMSLMGGYFGPELRFAGVDGIILQGAAARPVYLKLIEGQAELVPAAHLWGKTTRETEHALEAELGLKRLRVASIGPAGENLVRFASLMHGGDAMGRGGIGAVMGSKKLKAIVASGQARPPVHDPARLAATLKRLGQVYKESEGLRVFGETGTTEHVDGLNLRGIYPTRNFQAGRFEQHEAVNADVLYTQFVNKRVTCFTCPVRCRREAEVKTGAYAGVVTEGPEYETMWGFGGNCGNASLDAIIAANDLCLEYGLDTISTGSVVGFAMECFEKGLLTEQETDGLELRFGNHAAMVELVRLIGRGEGIGHILGQGTKRAAEWIGRGAEHLAMQVKGLELAGYEPRGAKGMALGYATSPRGGCHERGLLRNEVFGAEPVVDRYAYEGKAQLVKTAQDTVAVKDSLGFCVLSSAGTSLADMADMLSAVTGQAWTVDDLMLAGERIFNLERLFNLREGFTRTDDTLPRRMLQEPLEGPDGQLHTVDLERLLNDFYAVRGWDEQGVPRPETLARLGLEAEQAALASAVRGV